MKKQNITMIVLAVLLVVASGYIGVGKWNESEQEEQLEIFQQGAQYGYEQAVIQVAQQVATCQQVPLRIENHTISIVSVECLQ